MTGDKAYEELGRNYRFFATWRHLTFAAGAAVWGVILKLGSDLGVDTTVFNLACIVGAFGEILLMFIDQRTRVHTDTAVQQGAQLEGELKGFFSGMKDRKGWPTHNWIARIFYVGSALAMIWLVVSYQ